MKILDVEFKYMQDIPYTRDEIIYYYWRAHPRFRFIKTCNPGKLLDIGTGSGGLYFWLRYGGYNRDDINMYGVDLVKGEFVDKYDDFKQMNLNEEALPYQENFFENGYTASVIEHLQSPGKVLADAFKCMSTGVGLMYIEDPNNLSCDAPSLTDFAKAGYTWLTNPTNFYDDSTHIRPYPHDEIVNLLKDNGCEKFDVLEEGTIWNNSLTDVMLSYAIDHQDAEIMTYALWNYYRWNDYVIIEKRA